MRARRQKELHGAGSCRMPERLNHHCHTSRASHITLWSFRLCIVRQPLKWIIIPRISAQKYVQLRGNNCIICISSLHNEAAFPFSCDSSKVLFLWINVAQKKFSHWFYNSLITKNLFYNHYLIIVLHAPISWPGRIWKLKICLGQKQLKRAPAFINCHVSQHVFEI